MVTEVTVSNPSFLTVRQKTMRGSSSGHAAGLTIATMPARTASGISSQRSTRNAKPADLLAKNAKQNAKSFSGPLVELSEVISGLGLVESTLRWRCRFSRPAPRYLHQPLTASSRRGQPLRLPDPVAAAHRPARGRSAALDALELPRGADLKTQRHPGPASPGDRKDCFARWVDRLSRFDMARGRQPGLHGAGRSAPSHRPRHGPCQHDASWCMDRTSPPAGGFLASRRPGG